MHRAIVSLMEELEAIDWYGQRAEACSDQNLKEVILHNRDEEIEHASMVLEWIRRHNSHFNDMLQKYLFTDQPIVGIEEATKANGSNSSASTLGIGALNRR